jgi:hypothetical protein
MKAWGVMAVLLGWMLALPCTAAEAYKAPRNALGQPDLEGVWSFNYLTGLERADAYPSVVITEAQAGAIRTPPMLPPDAVGQDQTETYDAGLALARIGEGVRTAWIVDPPDGRLPFTSEGRARALKPPSFDGPEPRTTQERCILSPGSGPPIVNSLYNNNLQILQTRENLVIFQELMHDVRIIPIGRRAHAPVSRWMGDSIGWWEGEDFVIETTHFAPGQSKRYHPLSRFYLSPEAVVMERLRRISPNQILYSYTVTDPANYTKPWRGEMPLQAGKGPIYEYACHEGNYSLPGILAGARAEERAAVEKGRN